MKPRTMQPLQREEPVCRLSVLPWAAFFGLEPRADRRKVCARVTEMIPLAARRGYTIDSVLSRGAYGIVFTARRAKHPPLALKLQFVCPKRMTRAERRRCGGYGQRASLYETVRYEARTHADIYRAAAGLAGSAAHHPLPLPRIPRPVAASRLVLGRHGEFPDVPPDGRRRLWVSLMELVPHPSLRGAVLDARDRGTLTAGSFFGLMGGVARHLAGMHARLGYTHGDAHTGNFLVDLASGTLFAIDLERAISADFLRAAPGLGTRARRAALWKALRMWDLKVFCESVVNLAETARVWERRGGAGEGAGAAARSSEPPPTSARQLRRVPPSGLAPLAPRQLPQTPASASSAAPPAERLGRAMLLVQAIADAYERAWGERGGGGGAGSVGERAWGERGGGGGAGSVGERAWGERGGGGGGGDEEAAGGGAGGEDGVPVETLAAWAARALFLKRTPDATLPAEIAPSLANIDVRGIDRKAHREFFALLRAAQAAALATPSAPATRLRPRKAGPPRDERSESRRRPRKARSRKTV